MTFSNDSDKVSVVIPCYNDGEYLNECLESVFNQTYNNVEIIIVDDGSTEEKTKNVLSTIFDDNVQILSINHNGPAKARNIAITHATGKYILPLDADDKIAPTYIEKAVDILNVRDNVGIVYCKAKLFGCKEGIWQLGNYDFKKMIYDNIIFVTSMFRRSDWEVIGGFSHELVHGMEDYDFWLSILELDRQVVQIPEVLFFYRIKEKSRTTMFAQNRGLMKQTYNQLYLRHKKFYLQHLDDFVESLRNITIDLIEQRDCLTFDNNYLHSVIQQLNADNNRLHRQLWFVEKIKKIPIIGLILKKIYQFIK